MVGLFGLAFVMFFVVWKTFLPHNLRYSSSESFQCVCFFTNCTFFFWYLVISLFSFVIIVSFCTNTVQIPRNYFNNQEIIMDKNSMACLVFHSKLCASLVQLLDWAFYLCFFSSVQFKSDTFTSLLSVASHVSGGTKWREKRSAIK